MPASKKKTGKRGPGRPRKNPEPEERPTEDQRVPLKDILGKPAEANPYPWLPDTRPDSKRTGVSDGPDDIPVQPRAEPNTGDSTAS